MPSEPTALVVCLYRRPHLLARTLRDLAAQTTRPDRVVLVNNNPEIREQVDRIVGRQAEVVHNPENGGGWARFVQARRLSREGIRRVVFIDDDMTLDPGFVATLCAEYREDAVVGAYAFVFQPPFDDYWTKSRVTVGAEAHYVGTCGLIAPARVFDDPGIEACPERFRMGMEDLWLSAFCRDCLDMRLIRSRAVLSMPQGNDGQATWRPLRAAKSQMLQWLHATMGFPRPRTAAPDDPQTKGWNMPRESLLVCCLLPEYFGRRSEDRNLLALVEEWEAGFSGRYRLKLLLGSAYPQVLERAAEFLKGHPIELEAVVLPYVHRAEFDARRATQISFCKQELARRVRGSEYDIALFIDSDIYVPFADVDKLAAALAAPRSFVNIPYVIHRSLEAPPIQLGAYMHRKALFDELDYTQSIYRTAARGGRVYRTGAPDCAVRMHLLRCGATEIRAQPPQFHITTRHYSDDGTYGVYRAGRMTRHSIGSEAMGFDPVKSQMAMEPESCAFLVELCRRAGARTALDVGTGLGNSLRSLIAGGVTDIVSVDHDERWTKFMKDDAPRFGGKLELLTCPIVESQGVWSYDLSGLRDRRFDVAVIDGPQANAPGRLAAATAVDAAHYVFHDSIRDAAAVAALIESHKLKGNRCQVMSLTRGRGMAWVSVEVNELAREGGRP